MFPSQLGIAFFRPTGIFGHLITIKDPPYSHVELYDPQRTIQGDDGQSRYYCFSSYEGDGGVRWKHIHLDKHAERYTIPIDPFHLWAWCDGKVGAKYDWAGILGFLNPMRRHDKQRWFCSEICLAAIQQYQGGLPWEVVKQRPEKTTPSQLFRLLRRNGLLSSPLL
jgi:hypothetical protein